MAKFPTFLHALLWLLCASLLVTRIGGAHVHLCFDGSEPSTALHVADDAFDHPAEIAANQHNDRELEWDNALIKKDTADLSVPALAVVLLLILALAPRRIFFARNAFALPSPGSAFHLRPPLRGPPR